MQHLESVSWHDLPVDSISIGKNGLRLVVTPFDEHTRSYGSVELTLEALEGLTFELSSQPTSNDLGNIEVATFDFKHIAAATISGSLGLLPGSGGYWSIKFQQAKWTLVNLQYMSTKQGSTF